MVSQASSNASLRNHFLKDPGYHIVDHASTFEKMFDSFTASPVMTVLFSIYPKAAMSMTGFQMFFHVQDSMKGGRIKFDSQNLRFQQVAASRNLLKFGWDDGSRLWFKDYESGSQWFELTDIGLPGGRHIKSMVTSPNEMIIQSGRKVYRDHVIWVLDDQDQIYLFGLPANAKPPLSELYHPIHWKLHTENRGVLSGRIKEIFALSGAALLAVMEDNRLYYSDSHTNPWRQLANGFATLDGPVFVPSVFEAFPFGSDVSIAASDSDGNIYYTLYLNNNASNALLWKKIQHVEHGVVDFDFSHDGKKIAIVDGNYNLFINMHADNAALFSIHDQIISASEKIGSPDPSCGYFSEKTDLTVYDWEEQLPVKGALCGYGAPFYMRDSTHAAWGAPHYPQRLWLDASSDTHPLNWSCARFFQGPRADCSTDVAPAPERDIEITVFCDKQCQDKKKKEAAEKKYKEEQLTWGKEIKAEIREKMLYFKTQTVGVLRNILGLNKEEPGAFVEDSGGASRIKFGGGTFDKASSPYYNLVASGFSNFGGSLHHVRHAPVRVGGDAKGIELRAWNSPLYNPFSPGTGDALRLSGLSLETLSDEHLDRVTGGNLWDDFKETCLGAGEGMIDGAADIFSGDAEKVIDKIFGQDLPGTPALKLDSDSDECASSSEKLGRSFGEYFISFFKGDTDSVVIKNIFNLFSGDPKIDPNCYHRSEYLFDGFGVGRGSQFFAWKDRSLYSRITDSKEVDDWRFIEKAVEKIPESAWVQAVAPGRDGKVWVLDTEGSMYQLKKEDAAASGGHTWDLVSDPRGRMKLQEMNTWQIEFLRLRRLKEPIDSYPDFDDDEESHFYRPDIEDILPLGGESLILVGEWRYGYLESVKELYFSGSSQTPWRRIAGNFGVYDGTKVVPFTPEKFDVIYYDYDSKSPGGGAIITASDGFGGLYCTVFSPDKGYLPLWHKMHEYKDVGLLDFDFTDDGRKIAFIDNAHQPHLMDSVDPQKSWADIKQDVENNMGEHYLDHLINLYNHGDPAHKKNADDLRAFLKNGSPYVGPPVAVKILSGKTADASADVSWKASSGEPGSVFYHLQISRDNAAFASPVNYYTKETSFDVKTRADGHIYARVKSMNIFGAQSDFVSLGHLIKDATPPSRATGLAATPFKNPSSSAFYNSVRLSWDATSDGDRDDLLKWRIYRKRFSPATGTMSSVHGLNFLAEETNKAAFSYVDSSAVSGIQYDYAVTPVDDVGNENKFVDAAGPTLLNNAPRLDTRHSPMFATINEDDSDSSGDSVRDIVGSAISDHEVNPALRSIAVTKTDNRNGSWQHTHDTNSANRHDWVWTTILDATDDASGMARLLSSSDRIRFLPGKDFHGTAGMEFKAWDETSGNHGGRVDASPDGGYSAFSSGVVVAGITVRPVNDPPSFVPGELNLVIDEDAGFQTVAPWATEISSGPANESGQTLSFTTTHDRTVSPDPAKRPELSYFHSAPAIELMTDASGDATGALTYNVAPNVNSDASGDAWVTVYLQDNGGLDNGGSNVSEETLVSIVVNSVNDAPSFVPVDQTVDEDAGAQSVGLNDWAHDINPGAANEAEQTLSFSVISETSDPPSLFSATPSISNDGTLSFAPTPDQFGEAVVTVGVADDGGIDRGGVDSAEFTLNITVNSVNDAPSFSLSGSEKAVDANSGAATMTHWVSSIRVGPDNEAGQTPSFVVTSTNPSLFSRPPAIDGSGTLTFTPARNRSGLATVTVKMTDDGGTEHSGVELSAPQTFVIRVNPPPSAKPRRLLTGKQTAPVSGADQTGSLTPIHQNSDDGDNPGDRVADLLMAMGGSGGGAGSKNQGGGMAVTQADNANGVWQFSLDGGQTWHELVNDSGESAADQNAALLSPADVIRFVPHKNWAGEAGVRFRLWDQSDGRDPGQWVDATSLSGENGSVSVTVLGLDSKDE